MSKICAHFDDYFAQWSASLGALCSLLVPHRAQAQDVAFQSFLRLGGGKDAEISEQDARILLFQSAVRLCDDYYLKKMHRRPRRKDLAQTGLPCPDEDALYALLRLPFRRRAALALMQAGFAADELPALLGVSAQQAAALCAEPDIPGWQAAISALRMTEDEAQQLSDRIVERFSERSVNVENAIHDARNAFDRAAPFLALLVLALFALSIWYVKRL